MEELIEAKDVAAILKIKPITLYRWRLTGKGPAHAIIARKLVYSLADLIKFCEAQKENEVA